MLIPGIILVDGLSSGENIQQGQFKISEVRQILCGKISCHAKNQ